MLDLFSSEEQYLSKRFVEASATPMGIPIRKRCRDIEWAVATKQA